MFEFGNSCVQIIVSYLGPNDVAKVSEFYKVNLKQYLRTHSNCAFGRKARIYKTFCHEAMEVAQYLIINTNYTTRLVCGQENMSYFINNKKTKRNKKKEIKKNPSFFDECEKSYATILKNALAISDFLWGNGIYLRNDIKNVNHKQHEDVLSICKKYDGSIIFDYQEMKRQDVCWEDIVHELKEVVNYCAWYATSSPTPFEIRGTLCLLVDADTESG